MTELIRSTVVVLHDRDHGDFSKVLRSAGFFTPLRTYPMRIHSFTDMYPEDNPHNNDLQEIVFRTADLLFMQDSLLRPITFDAQTVVSNALLSPVVRYREFYTFNEDYEVDGAYSPDQFNSLVSEAIE